MKKINSFSRVNPDGRTTASRRSTDSQSKGRYSVGLTKLLFTLSLLLTLGVGQMWAATATTVYYAVNTSYTVKCNVNRKGDGSDWATYTMTKTAYKYNDKYIYSCSFTDLYDGLGCLQFQLYDGSTWKSQVEPISSWTSASTYNGKLYVSSWIDYRYDHTISNGATVVWDNAGNTSWANTYLYKEVNGGSGSNSSAFTRCGTSTQWYKTYASAETKIGKLQFRANTSNWNDGTHTTDLISAGDLSGVTLFTYMNTKDGYALNWQVTTNAKKATSGTKIYFDNTDAWSGEIWLKYGTSTYNRSSAARATQVTGTANLYVITIPNDCYFEKYYLASDYGWTGYNPINDTHVSKRIDYQASNLTSDITYVATGSTSGSSPTVYATTSFSGHTRRLTFGSHTNGQITVRYTDENGDEQTVSSASASYVDVAQTCNVVITAVPNTGYAPSGLTLNSSSITSGATQTIRADGTIAATFVAETTYNITVSYKYGSRTLHDAAVYSVGVTTPSNISSETIDGFEFDAWSDLTNVKNNTGDLVTDPININSTTAAGSMTCNYTPWDCSLDVVPSSGSTTYSSRTAMSYDATTEAYYKNFTTTAATQYFRFYINSIEYAPSSNTEMVIAGTKVTAATDVTSYAENKPSVFFNDGGVGSNITVWFDYENKKAWVTEQKHTVTISAGDNGSVSPTSVSVGNVVKSGSITATPSSHYHLSSWTIPSGVTLVDGSTTTSPITIKATADSKTVTANFAGDVYTITYKDQGGGAFSGSQTTPPTSHTYGTATTLKIPTKSGYTFGGWFTSIDCTTGAIGNTSSASLGATAFTANITLYAKWTENMTTVTLVASPASKGSFTIGGAAATSTTAGVTTTRSVTAVAATGYRVNTSATVWAKSNSNITLSSTTANPVTVTGCGTAETSSTLTATFTPKTYTITLHEQGATTHGTPGDGGTITVTYDANTNLSTITALPARTGYTFDGYYDTPECDGAWIIQTDRYFNWDGTYLNSSTGVWQYDGNLDLYAKWVANQYTVTLDVDEANKGNIASATTSQNIYYDDATVTVPNRPTAANGYALDGYYTDQLGEGVKVINADGTWIANVDGYTDASKHWVHADDITLYAYYKKAEITAITFDNAVVESKGTVSFAVTISPTPTGTTKTCFTVLHSNDNPLAEQPTITYNGGTGKYSFTAPEASGTYKIQAVLRTGSSCDGGDELDTEEANFQVAGLHSVNVRYKCGDEVIKAATTLEGIRPLDWSDAITAPNIIGYSFTGWSAGDGVTLTDDDGSSTKTSTAAATIKIKAIYDGYLTANYSKKRIIYFNNTLGWDTVVVYFYKNSSYWGDTQGTGANTGYTFTYTPYSEGKHGGMQRVAPGSNIWYFDAEAAGVNASYQTVAFTDKDQHGYGYFYDDAKVIKRDDYYSTKLPMFVPVASQTPTDMNSNKAHYYNEGYWMNYPENTGYTLKIYNQKATAGAVELKSIPFEFSADKTMPMELNVDLEAGKTYGFKIYRNDNDGSFWGNTGTMTANSEGWDMTTEASSNTGLQTTAAGDYKFQLNYYAVSSTYHYRVSVTYPVTTGDYRLLYKDNVHTTWHPSAVIPKAKAKDTVSFFVRKGQSAYLKLQKCTGLGAGTITWSDTVTWWDGSSLPAAVTQDSVYNICLKHNASTGKLEIENVEAYTGNFYIRTDAANSKWDNYRTDQDHLMTYSEYSISHGGYSHYYTHWVQTDDRKNIKFTIANDFSPCISDTLTRETASGDWTNITYYIESNGDLKRNANVRFMWNRHDNTISRAYVDGAQDDGSRFLVISSTDGKIKKADGSALSNDEVTFSDNENWIYEANVKAQSGAQIKLKSIWGESNTIEQYFKGSSSATEALIGGSGENWYDIRILYDFKTNRLIASYIPVDENITTEKAIEADIMFIREHQGDIAQLTFGENGKISKIETAYGVMRFNKWTLANKDKSAHTPLASPASIYERSLFWISFPFKVKLSEVIGFGTYGVHWAVQRYDGESRAAKGHFLENGSFWKWMNRNTEYLEPNQGYLLAIDLDLLGESSDVWGPESRSEQIEIYFPSFGTMPDITNADVPQTLEAYECTINRAATEGLPDTGDPRTSYNRTIFDSHWHVMSVPTYVNTDDVSFANTTWTGDHPSFLYTWNADDNTITATSASGYTYHAMHAYMVQYSGDITWSAASGSPASIVARRTYAEEPDKVEFRLELQQNEKMVDRTFIALSDDEEVSTGFKFGEDMTKEFNSGKSSIYTFIANEAIVAGNTLPMTEQTTIVPVGVDVKANGDYTFAIPDGTNGVGVTLIDNETGIRTSLSALDYTVFLEAGTYDGRFVMEISPIVGVWTNVENVQSDDVQSTKARKVIIDQNMYIIKNGKMFDARGAVVK